MIASAYQQQSAHTGYLPGLAPEAITPRDVLSSSPEKWLSLFLTACAASIAPRAMIPPDEWSTRNIIFSRPGDPIQGPIDFSLSPFLLDPVRAWDVPLGVGIREVTFVAPEQMGKTLSWMCGLLWSAVYRPGVSLIFYTSDVKAKQVNETKVLPLISSIPDLKAFLDLPNSANASQYRLGPATINFGGVGARISSITSSVNIADELDDWAPRRGVDPLADLRKRARAFSMGILYKVCTPKGTEHQSRIWNEFLQSSQGYWHLRCLHCGELTIRSCDVHHLKFELAEKTEKGVHALPVADSIRLVCPACGHAHTEEERPAMVRQGAYIHKYPSSLNNLGFQVGYLANLRPSASFVNIATAQVKAGKSGDADAQRYFDNSIRGLPFRARRLDTGCERALRIHQVPMPDASTIRWRFLAADTQENCFYYTIRGMDLHRNTYLLDCGKLATTAELKAAILGQYCGGPILAAIIDEGGHRQDEVRALADELPRVYTYKGNTFIRAHYKISEDYPKLLLGHAEFWRIALLQKIYASVRTDNGYWYTSEAMTDDYIRQISAWTRPASGKTRDELADGDVSCFRKQDGAPDHLFDSEKMCLMLMDYTWQSAIRPMLERRLASGGSAT